MTLVILQEKLLGISSFIYLAATVFYLLYMARRSETVGRLATGAGLLGVAIHTAGLITRWLAAGFDHPPFTNLYESLVFFGWGIVAFYLYMEIRYKVRIAGAFVFPIALAAMMIAVTHQTGIEPLPDALKSWWLHIHVVFAAIAYAAFVVAFAFSLLFLIKDRVSFSAFGLVVSALGSISLLMVQMRGGTGNITHFFLRKAVMNNVGKWVPIMIQGTSPPEYHVQEIPLAGPILLVTCLLLAVATVMFIIDLVKENDKVRDVGGYTVTGAAVAFVAAMLVVSIKGALMNDVALRLEPFLLALLGFLCLASCGAAFLFFRRDRLIERLPPAETLDYLGYRSVVVAFPLMTIVIVTGAVWAQSAWGRYWGWDPKETASLVTWILYAVYLHTRIVVGWKERPSAIINMIAFISVIFTYLGVNVFLSGLHSYAKNF